MKSKAFSLIEIIVALMILSLIALFAFPSAYNNMRIAEKTKDKAKITFALQGGLELGKNLPMGDNTKYIGGYDINISVSPYENSNLKSDRYIKIRATYGGDSLEVIEVRKWKEPLAF